MDGKQGEQGPPGDIGKKGKDGYHGEKGFRGDPGDQGPDGDIGPKGDQGSKSIHCPYNELSWYSSNNSNCIDVCNNLPKKAYCITTYNEPNNFSLCDKNVIGDQCLCLE